MGFSFTCGAKEEDAILQEAPSAAGGQSVAGCHGIEQMLRMREAKKGSYIMSILRSKFVFAPLWIAYADALLAIRQYWGTNWKPTPELEAEQKKKKEDREEEEKSRKRAKDMKWWPVSR